MTLRRPPQKGQPHIDTHVHLLVTIDLLVVATVTFVSALLFIAAAIMGGVQRLRTTSVVPPGSSVSLEAFRARDRDGALPKEDETDFYMGLVQVAEERLGELSLAIQFVVGALGLGFGLTVVTIGILVSI